MLEGKEVEGKIGDVATYSVDVDKTGKVALVLSASKDLDGVKIKSENSIEVELFTLLEKVAAKTETKWDDTVVAQLKAILGMVG